MEDEAIDVHRPAQGSRALPHTADIRVEAWAPTREQCLAEAVRGMVGAFVDVTEPGPTRPVEAVIPASGDEDLLIDVLDEVIYLVDTTGLVPVATEVIREGDGVRVRLEVVDAARVTPIGAAPKAVSLHDLHIGTNPTGWSCAVTVDV